MALSAASCSAAAYSRTGGQLGPRRGVLRLRRRRSGRGDRGKTAASARPAGLRASVISATLGAVSFASSATAAASSSLTVSVTVSGAAARPRW